MTLARGIAYLRRRGIANFLGRHMKDVAKDTATRILLLEFLASIRREGSVRISVLLALESIPFAQRGLR